MKTVAAILLLASLQLAGQPAGQGARKTGAEEAGADRAWMERWMHNPRQTTEESLLAYREERYEDAVPPADRAERLASEDFTTRFNAAATRLAAGQEEESRQRLEELMGDFDRGSQKEGDPSVDAVPRAELEVATAYNLGNARLGLGDAPGAVEAFIRTLRLDPENADAKHNLELALREAERQQQEQQRQGDDKQEGDQGDQEPGEGGSGRGPPTREPGNEEAKRSAGEAPENEPDPRQDRPQPGEGEEAPENPGESRLENFEDQPDMSAEEAAAILEAVENLERRQRQELSAERARKKSTGGKDW